MPRKLLVAGRWSLPSLAAAVGLVFCTAAHAQESWDAIYLAGSKVGYVHTYVERLKHKGKDYQRVRIDIEQKLKRGKDTTITRLSYGTIETPDGRVLKLDTLTWTGEQKLRAHGDVTNGRMKLILEGSGEEQSQVIPWSPDVRGPYAAEQSMAGAPLKEHEVRTLKMFMPTLNRICDIQLQSHQVEPTVLGDGQARPLLPSSRRPSSTVRRGQSSTSNCGSTPRDRSSSKSKICWAATSSIAPRGKPQWPRGARFSLT
jgi:hypothetical protein